MAEENNQENNENQANADAQPQPSIVETAFDAITSAASGAVETVTNAVSSVAKAITGDGAKAETAKKQGRRAQKIGTVSSDKMTKTVVVNVDRQILHPKYRRYIRRTTKFMAHDETGASIGDKVRIEETRPLSARKRWQVVEVIQKAAK